MERGYYYYLDGAGGGGITNWSGGVRRGLQRNGYDGSGEMFTWQTGLGALADQTAGNSYKRRKAAALARRLVEYRRQHPDAPVTMIGLSAGTALTVFALESLPGDVVVENVFLLSGSLSATYDLTEALRHVRGKMYVTTSRRDAVLTALVPLAGTADRGSGTTATIGVQGPQLPSGASAEARRVYNSKLVVMPWRSEFARYGNFGGHTDTVATAFIEHYVAPQVATISAVELAGSQATAEGPQSLSGPA
jgi:pimeloyl-ACP methyl ester carboxylesterase